jgi:hypothetical protein
VTRRILLILFCIQTFCFIVSFQTFTQSRQNLVGVWEFVELLDLNDRKIDTIRHTIGWEVASGPIITFKKNGTYSKRFTPKNIDYGTWTYSGEDKVIVYRLNLNKEEDAKLLVANGLAKTDNKGTIYQESETAQSVYMVI